MRHTEIAVAQPFVGVPRINIAGRIGASTGKPMMIRIPVTGERPVRYYADGLPEGLYLDGCVIRGTAPIVGEYMITLRAENALGECMKKITLE